MTSRERRALVRAIARQGIAPYCPEAIRLARQEQAITRTSLHYKLHLVPVQDALFTMPGYRNEVWHAKSSIVKTSPSGQKRQSTQKNATARRFDKTSRL